MQIVNNFMFYVISFLSNTYYIESTTTETTTENSQLTTYSSNINKQNKRCIYNSYCLPIIITISTILFFILLIQSWQYYKGTFLINKHSKKNKRVTYVVSNVYEYNNPINHNSPINPNNQNNLIKNIYAEI